MSIFLKIFGSWLKRLILEAIFKMFWGHLLVIWWTLATAFSLIWFTNSLSLSLDLRKKRGLICFLTYEYYINLFDMQETILKLGCLITSHFLVHIQKATKEVSLGWYEHLDKFSMQRHFSRIYICDFYSFPFFKCLFLSHLFLICDFSLGLVEKSICFLKKLKVL